MYDAVVKGFASVARGGMAAAEDMWRVACGAGTVKADAVAKRETKNAAWVISLLEREQVLFAMPCLAQKKKKKRKKGKLVRAVCKDLGGCGEGGEDRLFGYCFLAGVRVGYHLLRLFFMMWFQSLRTVYTVIHNFETDPDTIKTVSENIE